jgi:hypothetical protein
MQIAFLDSLNSPAVSNTTIPAAVGAVQNHVLRKEVRP